MAKDKKLQAYRRESRLQIAEYLDAKGLDMARKIIRARPRFIPRFIWRFMLQLLIVIPINDLKVD